MNKVLQQIRDRVFNKDPKPKPKAFIFAKSNKYLHLKKDQYKIGKVIFKKHKVKLHKESQQAALRIYEYYKILKGNWKGFLLYQLGKIIKAEYQEDLATRKTLQEFYKVEGSTFSERENVLKSQPIEESCNYNTLSHWLTKWKINKPITQNHERISEFD